MVSRPTACLRVWKSRSIIFPANMTMQFTPLSHILRGEYVLLNHHPWLTAQLYILRLEKQPHIAAFANVYVVDKRSPKCAFLFGV